MLDPRNVLLQFSLMEPAMSEERMVEVYDLATTIQEIDAHLTSYGLDPFTVLYNLRHTFTATEQQVLRIVYPNWIMSEREDMLERLLWWYLSTVIQSVLTTMQMLLFWRYLSIRVIQNFASIAGADWMRTPSIFDNRDFRAQLAAGTNRLRTPSAFGDLKSRGC